MPLHDLNEFFLLSASLRYQLDAAHVGGQNVLGLVLGRMRVTPAEREVLLRVIEYLGRAYAGKRRRVGTPCVLHPLRATALLARSVEQPELVDLLTSLLHDKLEDIIETDFEPSEWRALEGGFQDLVHGVDPQSRWFLMERLEWLTRRPGETYNGYLGRMLVQTSKTPEVLRVKLADRLDNTLDMRVAIADPIQGIDFFQTVFEIMFIKSYAGYCPDAPHPDKTSLHGAARLYQLFKNSIVLSLVRQMAHLADDVATQRLFHALAMASMKEAERIALHIFGYHLKSVEEQRTLLRETMDYVLAGGTDRVTAPTRSGRLDGLFVSLFEHATSGGQGSLNPLYADKPKMAAAAIAFVVIFLRFINDPTYYVHNISERGVTPDEL